MKKIFIILFVIINAICAFAYDYDFTVKTNYVNVYYKITNSSVSNRTVEVVRGPEEYPRQFDVPSSVTYSGKKYKVTGIGEDAFFRCSAITSMAIPNTVTYIGSYAFSNSSISTLEIPESVLSIGKAAFANTFINTLEIPNSVTSIGDMAFAQNKSLKTVTFPNSIIDVGVNLFTGCDSITHSIYNDKLYVHHAYFNREPIMEVPEGIKIIVGGASYQEGDQTLEEIILPESVDSLQERAIQGENLKKLTIKAPVPPRCHEETTFPIDIIPNITLYVSNADPAILERYKADPYWSNFNIVATDLSGGGKDDGKQYADVNHDGDVNSADVVCVYNYIIGGDTPTLTKENADVNADNEVNSADIVAIYNYIIGGSNPRQ